MIRQDALEHTYRLVAHSHQGAWPGSLAWRLVHAPLIIGGAMRRMRDKPQGRVIEPISEIGTADVRDRRECVDTGIAFEALDVEASQVDKWFPTCGSTF